MEEPAMAVCLGAFALAVVIFVVAAVIFTAIFDWLWSHSRRLRNFIEEMYDYDDRD